MPIARYEPPSVTALAYLPSSKRCTCPSGYQITPLTLVAEYPNLAVVQMQEELLLATYVESEPLPDGALPRRAEFLIERVLDRGGSTFVIAIALELVEGRGAHLDGLVSHFGGHVRVLCGGTKRVCV
jgi:hypothetical protein